jgi:hypothetical protein
MDGLGICHECKTGIEESIKEMSVDDEDEENCPVCCQPVCDGECDAYEGFY